MLTVALKGGNMSKKLIISIVAIIVVVGGVMAWSLLGKKDSSTNTDSGQTLSFSAKIIDACKVLTPEIATQYLGETPETSETPSTEASSDDINVSNCAYSTKFVIGQPASLRSASLLVRSAKTQDGADSNENVFTDQRPAGVETVSGYGNDAFWNPSIGQLNILKNNNWYIIQAGGVSPTNRTSADAKKLTDLLIGDL